MGYPLIVWNESQWKYIIIILNSEEDYTYK